jgi:hypothetical protein
VGNAYKVLIGRPVGKRPEDIGIDGRTILECT